MPAGSRPRPLHVVIIAPPFYPTPPQGYGGIELVVDLLRRGLQELGHRVTVYGAEGSHEDTIVMAPHGWGADLGGGMAATREMTYLARVFASVRRLGHIDIIHDNCGFAGLVGSELLDLAPVVHTVHGPINEPQRTFYESMTSSVNLVAISDSQRASAPHLGWAGMVHNAVDIDALPVGAVNREDPYLLCLARICADKGQHLAIEVARRAGYRLVLAGKIDSAPAGAEYYDRLIAPALDGRTVTHVANVAGLDKARLISGATALLAPITWAEPFGLCMAEAMVSGTPVVALRHGSTPELIVDGIGGFVVDTVDEMVAAIRPAAELDRDRCAASTRARFSPVAMASGYLDVFESVRTATMVGTGARSDCIVASEVLAVAARPTSENGARTTGHSQERPATAGY